MADSATTSQWVQIVVGSGVIGLVGAGALRAWKWFVERPLERAEKRNEETERRLADAERQARYWEGKAHELAGEIKGAAETATRLRRLLESDSGGTPSVPPPRGREELPTLVAIRDLQREADYAQEAERARQQPLNAPESLPTPRRPLPLEGLGGRQDHEEWKRRQRQAEDTPTEFRPRQRSHRDGDLGAMKPLAEPFPNRSKKK